LFFDVTTSKNLLSFYYSFSFVAGPTTANKPVERGKMNPFAA
jgi:hypothetical protein